MGEYQLTRPLAF